jgi:UDP-glucose:(glucosyl)LPS alpha-1,3-glucosyltransferase
MNSQPELHVAFTIDDKYARGAVVTAHSVRASLRDRDARVVFHVVDCDLSDDVRDRLAQALGREGTVAFHTVPNRLRMPVPRMWLSDASVARLHLGEVMPADVCRVLYLDTDVLVLEDITEMVGTDLKGNALGAVLNGFAPTRSMVITEEGAKQVPTGAPPPGHFNSGVLLIDLPRWREERIQDQLFDLHARYGRDVSHVDQDFLNHVFAGRWTPLPERWNKLIDHPVHGKFGNNRLDWLTRSEGILHYIGAVKPWDEEFPPNALLDLYQEYASELV